MLKFYLIYIGSFLICSSFAQNYEYQTIIDDAVFWQTKNQAAQNVNWWNRLSFENEDTIIDNQTYQVLNRSYSEIDVDHTLTYFIREDSTKKVFIYQNEVEQTLYDFNATPGDTVWRSDSIQNSLQIYYYVKKVDSIEILGALRKQFYIKSNWVSPSGKTDWKWIEGIGNASYGVLSFNAPALGYSYSFCSVLKSGEFCFSENSDNCSLTTYPSTFSLNDVNFVPNPATDFVSLKVIDLMAYKVYDSRGKLRLSKPKGESLLDISTLEKGVYYAIIKFSDDVKISRKFFKF